MSVALAAAKLKYFLEKVAQSEQNSLHDDK